MAIYYGDGSNSSSGRIIQVQKSIYTGTIAYHSIAQGAETNIPFVCTITPKEAASKIIVMMQLCFDNNTTHSNYCTLKRQIAGAGYTEPFIGDASGNVHRVTSGQSDQRSNSLRNIGLTFFDEPNTTQQIEYGFTLSHNDNNNVSIYINFGDGESNNSYDGRGACSIVCMEVAA